MLGVSMTYPLIAFIRMQRSAFKKSCIRLNTTRLCCNPYLRVAHFHALFLLCHFLRGVGLGIPLGAASCQPLHLTYGYFKTSF